MALLQDSLCKFAALESDTSQSSRQISWKWAYQMLELLRKFRNECTLSSPTMMYIIGTTMVEKGSSKYCLGSKAIANQLRHWVLKEAANLGKPQPEEVLEEEPEVQLSMLLIDLTILIHVH